jgi:hypothetical protein
MQILKEKRPWSVQVNVLFPTAGNHYKICTPPVGARLAGEGVREIAIACK